MTHRSRPRPGRGRAGTPRAAEPRRARLVSTAKVVAAGVGFFVAATQATDWVAGKASDPPPSHISGQITRVELRKNERLGDFLRRTGQSAGSYGPAQLAQYGNTLVVHVRVEGFQGARLPVRWSLLRAGSQDPVPGARFNQRDRLRFEPRGPDHTGMGNLWVPLPDTEGEFYLRITLDGPRGKPLDERDSPTFQVVPLS
jgi:hypothetical protein